MLQFTGMDSALLILTWLVFYHNIEVDCKYPKWTRLVVAAGFASLLYLVTAIIEAAIKGTL